MDPIDAEVLKSRREDYKLAARELLRRNDKQGARAMLSVARQCDKLLDDLALGERINPAEIPPRLNRPVGDGSSRSPARVSAPAPTAVQPESRAAAQLRKIAGKWRPKVLRRISEYEAALEQAEHVRLTGSALQPLTQNLGILKDMLAKIDTGADPGFHRFPEKPPSLKALKAKAAQTRLDNRKTAAAGGLPSVDSLLDRTANASSSPSQPLELIPESERDLLREEVEYESLLEMLDREFNQLNDLAERCAATEPGEEMSATAKKTMLVLRRQQKSVMETRKLVQKSKERGMPPPIFHV